jgi:G3E family GTPase
MATLPTVLIAGYLGAGKTTLVNHLLRHAQGRRIAVLVNDFGSVGIDAELIEGSSAGVLSLAGGCLCCSFGDDLVGALAGLARREPAVDVCLIELSGVALPAAVVRTARLVPEVDLVATLVLADATQIQRQAADRYVGETVRQQLQQADWLMLSKADLVAADVQAATVQWIARSAPQGRFFSGSAQQVLPELLLGWHRQADQDVVAERFANQPMRAANPRADALFESRSFALADSVDLPALGAALCAPGSGVLRAKGLVAGQLLQVAGGRWAVTAAPGQAPGRAVLIGLRGRWEPAAFEQRWGVD